MICAHSSVKHGVSPIVYLFLQCSIGLVWAGIVSADDTTAKPLSSAAPIASVATSPATVQHSDLRIVIPATSFVAVKELSGQNNYYTVMDDSPTGSIIQAKFVPPMKIVKLGYQLPDTCTNVKKVSWDWRILTPPHGSDEREKKKNDSGASIYLIFGDKIRTQILKYVYSEKVPEGTEIRKDPFPPMQKMYIIVKNSLINEKPGAWKHVEIDIVSDYQQHYGLKVTPQLKGIGIMSDGDETGSNVVAEYRNFTLSRYR